MRKTEKYELVGEPRRHHNGYYYLRRIRALRDIPEYGVKAGDLGGWIGHVGNLSQEGSCWVAEEAEVYGDAKVYGNAYVFGRAEISGEAQISDYAQVYGNAMVYGRAKVYGYAQISGKSRIHYDAEICIPDSPSSYVVDVLVAFDGKVSFHTNK